MTDPLNLTLADLAISPLNVRLNEADANAVEALSASIVEQGLLEQLLIHPAPDGAAWADRAADDSKLYDQRDPAAFGVLAGGRRYRAIRLAVARKLLPVDFTIRCSIKDLTDSEIVLLSLSENLLRRDLQGYEVHAAIAKLRELGLTVNQIAQNLGQTPDWVRKQARLGELHPEIFAAYCAGKIDVEQARAFAATEDRELQAAAWDHFAHKGEWDRGPAQIRAFYKVGDHQMTRLLLFVTETAYCEAGGRFELDLFASEEQHRGRVADEDLLHKLAEVKLKMIRAAIREQTGWRDLVFTAQPPQRAGYTDTALEIYVDKPEDLPGALPEGTPDSAVCVTLEMSARGTPITRFWWTGRKARADAEKGDQSDSKLKADIDPAPQVHEGSALAGWDQEARKIARDEFGLTADGLQVMRSQRRDLLRAALLRDGSRGGNLARDYLTFAQLRQILTDAARPHHTGIRRLANAHEAGEDEPREKVRPYLEEQLAGQYWKSAMEHWLSQPCFDVADVAEGFALFLKLDESQKGEAAALLAGLLLMRSANADGYRVPLHDKLAEIAGLDACQLRRFWEPVHAWAGLFPKMKRLELAQPFVDAEAFRSWPDHNDAALAAASAHVLKEQKQWVHPILRFDFAGFEGEPTEPLHEALEAAE